MNQDLSQSGFYGGYFFTQADRMFYLKNKVLQRSGVQAESFSILLKKELGQSATGGRHNCPRQARRTCRGIIRAGSG